jgi:chromosome segregation ATPase
MDLAKIKDTGAEQDVTSSRIRSRIEENAIQDCLKSSMGGYTKKSVQEYAAKLRSQQQLMSDNFNQELHRMLDEKDGLSKENARLNEQLDRLASEHRELTKELTSYQVEGSEITMQDVLKLKSGMEALENDKTALRSEIRQKELAIGQLQATVKEQADAAERAKREIRTCQEALEAEKEDAAGLRKKISGQNAKIEEQAAQLRYLNGIVSEGNVAELNAAISSLSSSAALQEQLIQKKDEQLAAAKAQNQALAEQLRQLRKSSEQLSQSLEAMKLQNEKLSASNQALHEKTSQVLEQSVALLGEKAQLNVEKLLAERKLEAALRRLSDREAGIC